MDLTRRGFFTAAGMAAGTLALTGVVSLSGCAPDESQTVQSDDGAESDNQDSANESVDNTVTYDDVEIEKASSGDIRAIIDGADTSTILVDARPQEAYSGWALEGAKNGGHLKGASLYSARWLDCDYMVETPRADLLKREMKDQGITSDAAVIVYDYTGEQASEVAKYLVSQGIKNCRSFQANEFIDDTSYVEADEHYDYFVPPELVKSVSDVKTGETGELSDAAKAVFGDNADEIVIVDVGWGSAKESPYFLTGHVPGAIHINTDCYERPRVYIPEKRSDYAKEWRLITIEEFRDELCPEYGITKDSKVIVTCSYEGPSGRIAFMLKTIGVPVYVMSGHLTAWKYNGYKLDTDESTLVIPSAAEEFGSSDIPNPYEILWMDDIKAILAGGVEGQVVDNRTEDEWKGEYSGYSYHDLAGHIDGTYWCEEANNFENPDFTSRTRAEYESLLRDADLDIDKTMAFFCGDSMGAAIIAWRCQSVGLMNVKEWGNGWIPWSNEGNEFVDHNDKTVHYDKWHDTVIDEGGNDVRDGVNILDDAVEQ